MKKVKVLSVAIADEFTKYLVCEAYTIELPDEYAQALVYPAGYPSFETYMYWDDITDQLDEATAFAECKFNIEGLIDQLCEQAKAELDYDELCMAPGEAGREDLAMSLTIERLRTAFGCDFVHNSRA